MFKNGCSVSKYVWYAKELYSIAMSFEHKSKFAALFGKWRRLHMSLKFSRRTETTNSHQVVMQVIQVIVTLQSNKDQFTLNLNSDILFL